MLAPSGRGEVERKGPASPPRRGVAGRGKGRGLLSGARGPRRKIPWTLRNRRHEFYRKQQNDVVVLVSALETGSMETGRFQA